MSKQMWKFVFSLLLWIGLTPDVNADITIPRLSPLPSPTIGISLSGQWKFTTYVSKNIQYKQPETDTSPIEVPGEWVMQGFTVQENEIAAYYKTFFVPGSWLDNQRVKLRCNGIYSECSIYINGQNAGSHIGGFTAFELDITDLVKPEKENEISIGVRGKSIVDSLASGSKYAVHDLGGITRDIYLYTLPQLNIAKLDVSTTFDASYRNAILKSEIEIANEGQEHIRGGKLQLNLLDSSGKQIIEKEIPWDVQEIAPGTMYQMCVETPVTKPHKWDSEHPYLYTLECHLIDHNGKVCESVKRKVGFRQIEVKGNKVYVNNHPIKLRGVCRHEVMPLRGRSVNNGQWVKDVDIFRRGNVNYIRTSHYPPDEALLHACDSLGMFVELEAPFCWAHETQVPSGQIEKVIVQQHVEVINQYRNHPSILMWSLGNESKKFDEYFSRSAEIIRNLDPTRPRIFSQWKPNGDNEVLEIANHHYPGPSGADTYRQSKRPVIFDEFCHLNAYNRKELSADPGLRDSWGELLDAMWNNMYHSEGVLGGAIWAGIDDTFILPDGKIVGYGTWGPIDGWRREKPEYWGMKKAFSPIKLKLKGNYDIVSGNVELAVENRYNFTNLSECKIHWQAGNKSGILTTDIAPHSSGTLRIPLNLQEENVQNLYLTIEGSQGLVIDEYKFNILPEEIIKKEKAPNIKWKYQDTKESITISTKQDGSTLSVYVINKSNGLLEGLLPTLMVLPLNPDGEGIQMTGKDQTFAPYNPVCTNWVAHSIEGHLEQAEPQIIVKGSYDEAEGKITYRFTHTGDIEMSYKFCMKKAVNPRQTGIVFTLPENYSLLDWKRKGYWSVYPDNHIGKVEGKTCVSNPRLPLCGMAGPTSLPTWTWEQDQTVNGTNLFRSTKKNILVASLSDENSQQRFQLTSDGTQSIRCWKDEKHIRILVADYNNAGSDRFLSSHAKGDYRPLRKGDIISGNILFRNLNEEEKVEKE